MVFCGAGAKGIAGTLSMGGGSQGASQECCPLFGGSADSPWHWQPGCDVAEGLGSGGRVALPEVSSLQ